MRILIVDDHALLVEGLCNLLVSRGFDVVGTAGDGREGPQVFQGEVGSDIVQDVFVRFAGSADG